MLINQIGAGAVLIYPSKKSNMLSVRAIYDGRELKLLEAVEVKSPQSVIVVFLDSEDWTEEEIKGQEIGQMALDSGALSFLYDDAEEVYSDSDLKVKYE